MRYSRRSTDVLGQAHDLEDFSRIRHRFATRPMRILLLGDTAYPAQVVRDHIGALVRHSRHRIDVVNPVRNRKFPEYGLDRYDAVLIHYSILCISDAHLPSPYRVAIQLFRGLKIQCIQDEYRWIRAITRQLSDLGTQVLFSSLRPANAARVYLDYGKLEDLIVFTTLSGYVPDALARAPGEPIERRPLHVSYRAREVPYWLGRHSRQKLEIAVGFCALAARHGLSVDISAREQDRLYGEAWKELLRRSKATLGTEGGASIFDFDGEVERQAIEYLRAHPGADFEEVFAKVLSRYEGNIVHEAFTPRLFEAMALRTAMVLFPGDYEGILEPWRHYLPLDRDFSNGSDIAACIRDDALLEKLVDQAFHDVIAPGRFSYRHFVAAFDAALDTSLEQLFSKGALRPSDLPSYRVARTLPVALAALRKARRAMFPTHV